MIIIDDNITMTRGDSESLTVSCEFEEAAFPLVSGDTIYFTVKENTKTTTKILQKVVTTFTNGKAIIILSPSDTKNLQYKNYLYDVQLTRANGSVKTIVEPHLFTISGEVTHE